MRISKTANKFVSLDYKCPTLHFWKLAILKVIFRCDFLEAKCGSKTWFHCASNTVEKIHKLNKNLIGLSPY